MMSKHTLTKVTLFIDGVYLSAVAASINITRKATLLDSVTADSDGTRTNAVGLLGGDMTIAGFFDPAQVEALKESLYGKDEVLWALDTHQSSDTTYLNRRGAFWGTTRFASYKLFSGSIGELAKMEMTLSTLRRFENSKRRYTGFTDSGGIPVSGKLLGGTFTLGAGNTYTSASGHLDASRSAGGGNISSFRVRGSDPDADGSGLAHAPTYHIVETGGSYTSQFAAGDGLLTTTDDLESPPENKWVATLIPNDSLFYLIDFY